MRLGKPIEHLQAALRATFSSGPIPETITTIARQIGYFGYLSTDAVIWVWDSLAIHDEQYHIYFFIGPFRKIYNFESRKGEETHKDFSPLLVSWDNFQSYSWRAEGKKHLHLSLKGHNSCQTVRLAKETKRLEKTKVWGEKDLADEAARETKLGVVQTLVGLILLTQLILITSCTSARDNNRKQLVIDLLDVWIPATGAELLNINEGTLGILG